MGVLLWVMDKVIGIRNAFTDRSTSVEIDNSVTFDGNAILSILKCGNEHLSYGTNYESTGARSFPDWETLPVYLMELKQEYKSDPETIRIHRARMYALLSHVSRCNGNIDHFLAYLSIRHRIPIIRCLGLLP